MNWIAIGAIAEAAILVSLIYVAVLAAIEQQA